MLLSAVQSVLQAHSARRVLVACSGGIDSVVLVDAVVECLGIGSVTVGHVDHAVRDESSSDAEWVENWCKAQGLQFLGARLPLGPTDEASLRTARYAELRKQKIQAGADFILTAHHQDDQAETVLLNLVRGTHWPTLAGISPARDDVLRPILSISKTEIHRYAVSRNLQWRDDWTNREPHYLRNRIRKELLPLMETRYRSGLRERLARLAADVRAQLNTAESSSSKKGTQKIGVFRQSPANKLPNSKVIDHNRSAFHIEKREWDRECLPTNAHSAVFDASVVTRVYVRFPRPGDRIQPMGMVGRKKLQDVFVDAKIPREHRASFMVLVDETEQVLWVPGIVRSARALVDEDTKQVWVCRTSGQ